MVRPPCFTYVAEKLNSVKITESDFANYSIT